MVVSITSANFPHKAEYSFLWANMDINPGRLDEFQEVAKKIIKYKPIYENIQQKSGVPWYVIGIIHNRESSCDFDTHLHNGDPLSARTTHEPKGYPKIGTPPFSFEYSAVEALKKDGLNKITDWSIEHICYVFEKFNGFGYRGRGVNSPYLWAGTDQYTKGKYVFDGPKGWSKNTVDKQLGAMGLIKTIMDMDTSILKPSHDEDEVVGYNYKTETSEDQGVQLSLSSRKWTIYNWAHKTFGGLFVGTSVALSSTDIPTAKSYLEQAKDLWINYGPVGLLVLFAIGFVAVSKLKEYTKEDIKDGKYIPTEPK